MRVLLLCLALAGCAGMGETECRSTDWYALGRRDGEIFGAQPMIDQYRHSCTRYGVQADTAAYMTGWEDGNMEFRQRTGWGGGPD